jgi:hypothetical protein
MVLKARDEASAKIQQVTRNLGGLGDQVSDLKGVFGVAMGALSAYAGTRGLGAIIKASVDSQMQLAQARFFLAGYGKEVEKNFDTLVKWGQGVQRQIGAGDEYATLVASKLMPRVKDLQKAQSFGLTLLRGERLGLLNAQDAANMMIRATEGNERAMRFLTEQLGISAPEFVSLATLFAELEKRIQKAEKAIPPFVTQWTILKQNFGDFLETAGLPAVSWLGTIFEWVNKLIERFPWLDKVASAAILGFATLMAAAGVMIMLKASGILGAITALGSAIVPLLLNPWTLAILAIVAAIVLIALNWDRIRKWLADTWGGIVLLAQTNWELIKSSITERVAATINFIQVQWEAFKNFWINLWQSVKDAVANAWDWVKAKVDEIMGQINAVVKAAMNLPMVRGAGGLIQGARQYIGDIIGRQFGGMVEAGRPYLVGERGAELFVPRTSGTIVPRAGGTIMIDMRGSVFLDERVAMQIGDLIISRLKKLHRIGL